MSFEEATNRANKYSYIIGMHWYKDGMPLSISGIHIVPESQSSVFQFVPNKQPYYPGDDLIIICSLKMIDVFISCSLEEALQNLGIKDE